MSVIVEIIAFETPSYPGAVPLLGFALIDVPWLGGKLRSKDHSQQSHFFAENGNLSIVRFSGSQIRRAEMFSFLLPCL